MSEKNIKSRIIHKHDSEENWLKSSFIPKQGEIIVYDADTNYTYERMKIGDGNTNVNSLPFVTAPIEAGIDSLSNEIGNVDSKVDAVSKLVGDTAVSEQIGDALDSSQANWNQEDPAAPDYIKNKPDKDDALALVIETGLVSPVVNENNTMFIDENNNIIIF